MNLNAVRVLLFIVVCCLIACSGQILSIKTEESKEQDHEQNHEGFVAIMNDFSKLALLVDSYHLPDTKLDHLSKDPWVVSTHKILRARASEGFCFFEDKAYVNSTVFKITTMRKSGIPEDQQKKCPIYCISDAEKTIPTAGQKLWKRTTTLGLEDSTLRNATYLNYTLSTASDPSIVMSESTYTLEGIIYPAKKLSGTARQINKGSQGAKTVETHINIILDVGEVGRPREVAFELAETMVIENEQIKSSLQRFYLDKQEITADTIKSALPIIIALFNWNWPHAWPKKNN